MLKRGFANGVAAEHLLELAGGILEDVGNVVVRHAECAGDVGLAAVLVVVAVKNLLLDFLQTDERALEDNAVLNRQLGRRRPDIVLGDMSRRRTGFLCFIERRYRKDGSGRVDTGDLRLRQAKRLGDLGVGRIAAELLR